jgi:hypothetical protein
MDDTDVTWLQRGATWIAGLCIVLVIVNAALMLRNQDAQRVVSQRQAAINQANQVSRVHQLLIETIARAAVQRRDESLVALLERHGLKINYGPAAGQAPPAAPPAPAGGKP